MYCYIHIYDKNYKLAKISVLVCSHQREEFGETCELPIHAQLSCNPVKAQGHERDVRDTLICG